MSETTVGFLAAWFINLVTFLVSLFLWKHGVATDAWHAEAWEVVCITSGISKFILSLILLACIANDRGVFE